MGSAEEGREGGEGRRAGSAEEGGREGSAEGGRAGSEEGGRAGSAEGGPHQIKRGQVATTYAPTPGQQHAPQGRPSPFERQVRWPVREHDCTMQHEHMRQHD